MSASAFSQNWFRVCDLRPRLRPHAELHRQIFRGGEWYVVQDDQTGRYHRLSPAAYHIVASMNGRRTVDEIWRATVAWLGPEDAPPTQDEVIKLLAQLHAADLIASDVPPDLEELAHRARDRASKSLMQKVRNPLALRMPLFDPDRFLSATVRLARPLFTVWGLLVWLATVATGATLTVMHWSELTENLVDRVLLAENILIALIVFPVVKLVHELGHGYAAKVWGGRVHEVGLMFLVLLPVPYVDASSASGFASKWQRAVVGGAGILVELFIAAVAIVVWVVVEPGLVRATAFNAALIAGISTLVFNANPLLRFDGYYVLADLVEIPNLATRANKYVVHLIKRHAFGLRESTSPVTAPGEAPWFVVYAVASFLYRMAIMVVIALFVAGQLFFVGVLLAVYAILAPLAKGLWWIVESPELGPRRGRAALVTAAVAAAFAAFLLLLPLPYATMAPGVVWLSDEAHVRTQTQGLVVEVVAEPGAPVSPGEILLVLDDPLLRARRGIVARQRDEIALRLEQEALRDRAREGILREQLAHAERALAQMDAELDALTVRSPRAGLFLAAESGDLPGRALRRGDLVGFVVARGDQFIRAVVEQDSADLVRARARAVSVALAHDLSTVLPGAIVREVPKAQRELATEALAGGRIAIASAGGDAPRALESVFEFDVAAPIPADAAWIGMRAHVRVDHGAAPLAGRLYRAARQLVMRHLDV